MTAFDRDVGALEKALLKVMAWPYKKERDAVLIELSNYIVQFLQNESNK